MPTYRSTVVFFRFAMFVGLTSEMLTTFWLTGQNSQPKIDPTGTGVPEPGTTPASSAPTATSVVKLAVSSAPENEAAYEYSDE